MSTRRAIRSGRRPCWLAAVVGVLAACSGGSGALQSVQPVVSKPANMNPPWTNPVDTNPADTNPVDTTTAALASSDNPFRTGRTLIIPHAGADGLFPENTLIAYERSLAMGGDVIDVDVSLSAEGVPVAFHDPTLERTTNGTGKVTDKTVAELAALDAGYQFGVNDEHPFRGQGIGVPTIEQILRRFPTTPATLDVKDLRTSAAKPVCDLLRSLNRTHDVYVGSDTNEQVMAFRLECPEVRTSGTDDERKALRAAREAGDLSFVTHQLVSQPPYRGDDGILRVTPQTLAFSHQMGIAVLTWVVNDPKDMRALIDMGVDGIYTSRPDLMLEVLNEHG